MDVNCLDINKIYLSKLELVRENPLNTYGTLLSKQRNDNHKCATRNFQSFGHAMKSYKQTVT